MVAYRKPLQVWYMQQNVQITLCGTTSKFSCVKVNINACIKSVVKLSYLLGAVACGEVCVAAPPAAFECLLCWAGVVVQQVLLQVLHHAKD